MNESELSALNLTKGDTVFMEHRFQNSIQGCFDSYSSNTNVFTLMPLGTTTLKNEYLSDIARIIKF